MANDKGFEFESVGLASVLTGNVLQIPPHQRDYAWTADKVQQLFSDLAAAKAVLPRDFAHIPTSPLGRTPLRPQAPT